MSKEWRDIALGDVVTRVKRPVAVLDGVEYPAVSVLKDGQGLGAKEPFQGGVTNYSTLFQVRTGDVVVRTITAFESPVAVAEPQHDATHVSQVFLTYEVSECVLPAYLGLYFRTPAFWEEMRERAQGTVLRRKTISDSAFRTIPLSLPPLAVQRRIVDLMEHLDNQVDHLRAEAHAVQVLTAVLRDSTPQGEHITLGDALTGVDSGYSVKTPGSPPEEGQARVLKISAVHPGTFRASEAKGITAGVAMPKSAKVRVGDILISRANTPERVAFCARVRQVPPDTYFPDLLWRLVPDETILCADYLEQILASPSARARLAATSGGSSTSMTKITKRSLRALTIPLPSMLEQQRFAQTCLAATRAHRGLLVEIARLSVARDHLLSALLAGQSVIPDSYDELLGVAS